MEAIKQCWESDPLKSSGSSRKNAGIKEQSVEYFSLDCVFSYMALWILGAWEV